MKRKIIQQKQKKYQQCNHPTTNEITRKQPKK